MLTDTKTYDISPKSELIKFRGTGTWFQVVNPNKFGNWSLNIYPEPDSLERLRELMLKNEFKKDDNGYYMQISRQTQIEFTKGMFTPVTPVKLRMKDGSPVTERIGDGSDIEVTCELRKYKVPNSEKWGNAIRLYGVTVENLIPAAAPAEQTNIKDPEPVW